MFLELRTHPRAGTRNSELVALLPRSRRVRTAQRDPCPPLLRPRGGDRGGVLHRAALALALGGLQPRAGAERAGNVAVCPAHGPEVLRELRARACGLLSAAV